MHLILRRAKHFGVSCCCDFFKKFEKNFLCRNYNEKKQQRIRKEIYKNNNEFHNDHKQVNIKPLCDCS